MELSAKYVYQVYRERSFSAAAKSLYISQPALSAAIARLEKELGIRIFDRSTIPLSLTPQGRIYIEAMEEIMESESNMRRRIRALSDVSGGSITIGGSSYASYFLMTSFCSAFHQKFPNIRVTLDIGNVGNSEVLWDKMQNDEVDLIMTYISEHSKFVTEPLLSERFIIAMHKNMKGAEALRPLALTRQEIISGNYDKNREIEDMSVFRDIEFFQYESVTAQRMTRLLGDFKTAPYTIINARHSQMHYNLMCTGIGAVMISDTVIAKTEHDAENLLFFVPRSRDSYRTIYLARKHGALENPIIRNFIQVAKDACASGEIIRSPDFSI